MLHEYHQIAGNIRCIAFRNNRNEIVAFRLCLLTNCYRFTMVDVSFPVVFSAILEHFAYYFLIDRRLKDTQMLQGTVSRRNP